MTRRTIATIDRAIELLEDCLEDYSERTQYFADNGKEGASKWNERMAHRCEALIEKLNAVLDEAE